MAGKLTALILAILVANPFCCCFAAEAQAAAGEGARGCCAVAAAAMAGAEDPAPAENDPCDCAEERRGEWTTVAVEKPMAPHWILLAEFPWEILPKIQALSGGFLHGASDLPDAVKPPGRVLSQVHCRYLL